MTAGPSLVIHLIVLGLVIVMPGWVFYHVWLRNMGFSWRVSAGLVLAIMTILLTNVASVVGYSLLTEIIVCGILVVVAGAAWVTSGRPRPEFSTPEWPQLLLMVFIFAVFAAPAFVLYLPLDTDAQGFGYLALMVREGGTVNTLAPFQPDVEYLYSPALFIWWAFFSDLFMMPMHLVMLGFSHIMGGFTALLAMDFAQAAAPDKKSLHWIMPITFTAGLGFFLNLMDAAYTSVFGLLFVLLFLTLALRAANESSVRYAVLASFPLAAVALTHPDTIIILLIGYIPFYATFWLTRTEERRVQTWVGLFVLIPVVGVALCIPWLLKVLPLFFEENVVSPFELSRSHWIQLLLFQGVLIPLIAIPGLLLAVRQRKLVDVLMITWLVFIIDFSIFGITDSVVGIAGIDLMRYAYPFSIAWHGPPIPYAYFAALSLGWLFDRTQFALPKRMQVAIPLIGLLGVIIGVVFAVPLLSASQRYVNFFGTFSSRADIAAMTYLRENASSDALILNYPYGFEGHWVPVIAERESTAFREQPFFDDTAIEYYARREALTEAYFDPATESARETLFEYDVAYVVIPQIVSNSESFGDMRQMIRWRWPEGTWYALRSLPSEANYLELVFEQDGAEVYRVMRTE